MITLYVLQRGKLEVGGMYLFSCFSRHNCYNQHGRYYHLANKPVLARTAYNLCLRHLLFLGMILQLFFSHRGRLYHYSQSR